MVRQFVRVGFVIVCTGWSAGAWALDDGYVKLSGGVMTSENYTTINTVIFDLGIGGTLPLETELDREFGTGFTGAAAVGFRPLKRLRLEIEGGYGKSESNTTTYGVVGGLFGGTTPSDTSLTRINGMLNGWYDLARFNDFALFAGVGAGISQMKVDSTPEQPVGVAIPDESDKTIAFAWQAGGGLSYGVTDRWAVSAEYRYFDTVGADIANSDFSGQSHIGLFAISYTFGRGGGPRNPEGDYDRRREPVNEGMERR